MARKLKEDLRTPDEIRADVPPEHAAARTPELHAYIESEVLRKLRAEHHPINISVDMILSFADNPYQVLDNENHPDAKLGVDGNRRSASLYDILPARPQNAKPFGEWNTGAIRVRKGRVTHFQNGEPVVEYRLWTQDWTDLLNGSKFAQERWPVAFELFNNLGGDAHEGYIGFQDHGDVVYFRNIRIKVWK